MNAPLTEGPGNVPVAAIQMQSGNDLAENLRSAGQLLDEAAAKGCKLALLPENCAFIGTRDEDKIEYAEEPGHGPIQEFFADVARRHAMTVVAGSVPFRSPDPARCFGASLVYDRDGRQRACYRKMHLFDVDLPDRNERYRESATMAPGDDSVVVETPIGMLGLSICYDMRFPELYRRLVDDGAVAFTVPAAFTEVTGRAHWHSLLRARAIENLAYVIAAGQHGRHPNGRVTYGHSLIVDPWGQVLCEQAGGSGVVMAEINPVLPSTIREAFPALSHRRAGLNEVSKR